MKTKTLIPFRRYNLWLDLGDRCSPHPVPGPDHRYFR